MSHWAHSPKHLDLEPGAYIVTAVTYQKAHFFESHDRLDYLTRLLASLAKQYGWSLNAWSVFPNHYHFVGTSETPQTLSRFIKHLHSVSAIEVNRWDECLGRKIWFQYWDTRLTDEKSFYTRLRYVMENPVRHGLVSQARSYKYCSAGWFEKHADQVLQRTVESFDVSTVKVPDDF